MKGRFIGENTRLVYDTINHIRNRKNKGLILSVDIEAAFDSLSWNFVDRVLHHYGFGTQFRKTMNMLYMNSNNFARIMLNGYLGEKNTIEMWN